MPTYAYACTCGHQWDGLYHMGKAPRRLRCPKCGGSGRKQISLPTISLYNAGDPERVERLRFQTQAAHVSPKNANKQLSVDPAEGTVRAGKRPRNRKRVVVAARSSTRAER